MTRRLRDLAQALGALAAAAALVVGVPSLLVWAVGNPFPASVPTIDEIRIVLTQSGDGFAQFVLAALAIVIWFLWAQLVVALLVEVVATLSRRPTPRLPTAPGVQTFAARLVATITLAATLAATPLAPAIGALNFDDIETIQVQDRHSHHHTSHALATNWSAESTAASDQDTGADADSHRVTLAHHTELWDLAEAAYGDGLSWKMIAQANEGQLSSDGTMIDARTDSLPAGTSIALPGAVDLAAVRSLVVATDFPAVNAGPDAVPVAAVTVVDDTDTDTDTGNEIDLRTHTVTAGESMWSIAEDQMGPDSTVADTSGYWGQVVAANNHVASGDIDLIYPGEELTLPSTGNEDPAATIDIGVADHGLDGVIDGPVVPSRGAPAADPEVEVLANEAIAEAEPESQSEPVIEAEQPIEAPDSASVAEASAPAEPPESMDQAPVSDGSETAASSEPAAVLGGSTGSSSRTSDASGAGAAAQGDVEGSLADERQLDAAAFAVAGLGTALVAAGIVGALRRRRALQWRMRAPGTLPLQPTSEAAAFEAVLAHAAAHVTESALGNGWQAIPLSELGSVQAASEIRAFADGRLQVTPLTDSSPEGEESGDGRGEEESFIDVRGSDDADAAANGITVWKAADDTPDHIEAAAGDPDERTSISIVVGTDPIDGSAVLLDLAPGAQVELVGEVSQVCQLARSMVVDLATSDRTNDVQVIVVGHSAEIVDLERVQATATYQGALDAVRRCGHAGADSGTPVVIVATGADAHVDDPAQPAALEELRSLGAVVAAPTLTDAQVRLTVERTTVTVWPSGTVADTAALSDHGYRSVNELVASTQLLATEPVVAGTTVLDVPESDRCPIEAGPIEVRILGPVDVAGAGAFSSVKAVDVVTYLAFHRHGVDADQLKTWVWPSFEPPTDKAFANVLSRARTGLGADDEGAPYLSRAGADRTYRLADSVTTDFDRFRGLVDLADQCADPRHELDMLRQALELVRGVPFTGGTTTSFSWADNHVRAHVEFALDEAVHRCADVALSLGELATARWAALKGLELVPGCEQCFRRRFLVASAGNNRQELRRAMADLERTTAAELGEPEAVDLISSDLRGLFDELDRSLMTGAT